MVNSDKGMCSDLLSILILKFPYSFSLSKFFFKSSDLRKQPDLKTSHGKEQIGIIFRINRDISIFPMNSGDASGQPIFNLPKNTSSKIDIMFHKSHPTIFRPTFPIIIANNILVIRVRILSKISLDKFSRLVRGKLKQNIEMVNIPQIYSDRMLCLEFY